MSKIIKDSVPAQGSQSVAQGVEHKLVSGPPVAALSSQAQAPGGVAATVPPKAPEQEPGT